MVDSAGSSIQPPDFRRSTDIQRRQWDTTSRKGIPAHPDTFQSTNRVTTPVSKSSGNRQKRHSVARQTATPRRSMLRLPPSTSGGGRLCETSRAQSVEENRPPRGTSDLRQNPRQRRKQSATMRHSSLPQAILYTPRTAITDPRGQKMMPHRSAQKERYRCRGSPE